MKNQSKHIHKFVQVATTGTHKDMRCSCGEFKKVELSKAEKIQFKKDIQDTFYPKPENDESLSSLLKGWLQFAGDVQPGDAAGQDWLDGLRYQTEEQIKKLDNETRN